MAILIYLGVGSKKSKLHSIKNLGAYYSQFRIILGTNLFRVYFFVCYLFFFSIAQQPLVGQDLLIIGFIITLRHTTLGRTPLDE